MTADSLTCSKRVPRGPYDWRPCGRPVKDDGLCGIHLAAKRKRERNDAARREVWKAQNVAWSRSRSLADQFETAGFAAHGHTDGVLLTPDAAEALLQRLAAEGDS